MSDIVDYAADKGPFASFGALLTLLVYRFWPATAITDSISQISKQVAEMNSNLTAKISDLHTQLEVARQASAGNEKLIEHRLSNLEETCGVLRSSISEIRRKVDES